MEIIPDLGTCHKTSGKWSGVTWKGQPSQIINNDLKGLFITNMFICIKKWEKESMPVGWWCNA